MGKQYYRAACSAAVIFVLFFFQAAFAEEPSKIALFPFEIHTLGNKLIIQENIYQGLIKGLSRSKQVRIIDPQQFASLIKDKTPNEELALKVGPQIGADYVLVGSAFMIGETLSMDARIIEIKGKKGPARDVFAQGKGGIGAAPQVAADLAGKVLVNVFGQKKIAQVAFKGNRKIEGSAIQNAIKSAKGKVYSAEDISQDVKSIYKMGYFNDVQAEVSDTPEGAAITFIVDEKPLISQVRIKGNDAVDTKDIEAVIATKPKQFVDNDRLRGDAEKIKDLFLNKGYLNAEIKYDTDRRDKDIIVNFNIFEGDRLYVKTIAFDGNKAFSDKELKKLMETSEKGFFSMLTDSGVLKRDKLKEDANKINAYYMNNGYIHAKVGDPDVTHDKKWIYVKFPITEGKRFKVGKVTISGDTLTVSRDEILKKLKINKKDYYDRESIVKDIDGLTQAANDEGYAYAEVTPNIVPSEATQKVDIDFSLSKGDKVFFNRIEISGNTKTRDKVIRRQIAIVEGDLFNRSKLKDSYNRLSKMRYFEEVDFQTEKGPRKDLMDVVVKVKEKPTGMFSIGAGYSALDKAVIMAQIQQQNLFGRGQSVGINASLGMESSNYTVFFIEPFLFDMPLWSKTDIWNTEREYDEYDLSSRGIGTTLGYPIWERIVGYLGYKLSDNDVSNVSDDASSYIKMQEGKILSSGLTATLSRDTTDDTMFPTKGTRNSISVEYTGGFLQGDAEYTKYMFSSTWFYPLPLDCVFGIRGRIGYIEERGGDNSVPVYDKFYLGGINSLRGLRDVGPKDPVTGDVIGGYTMLNFNTEVVFPLVKNAGMKGVVFYDTGNAWDSGYKLDDMRKTAGLGIRWYSPIGPLRLEWGYVLDKKSDESASRFEFTIGFFM